MFIIKEGYAYQIKNGKAYKIDFDENEKVIELNEELDSIEGYQTYTYVEIKHKLNVRHFAKLKREKIEEEANKPKVEKPKEEKTSDKNKKSSKKNIEE